MDCTITIRLDDGISISMTIQDGLLLYIDIDIGEYNVCVGGYDGESYIEYRDGTIKHRWNTENMEEYENYTDMFMDYYTIFPHMYMPPYSLYEVLRTSTSYKEFIDRLHSARPICRDDVVHHMLNLSFIEHDGIVKSIIFYTGTGITYSIGEIEYIYYADSDTSVMDRDTIASSMPYYDMIYNMLNKPYDESIAHMIVEAIHIGIPVPSTDNLICIKSPESNRCDHRHGIPVCISLIREKEWYDIQKACTLYRDKLSYIEHDHTSGCHGCAIEYNIVDMVSNCVVITDLTDDVIAFIRQIENRRFIEFVQQHIGNIQS